MRSKIAVFFLGGVLLVGLLSGTFVTGLLIGNQFQPLALGQGISLLNPDRQLFRPAETNGAGTSETATPAELEELFAPFWESWDIVHEEYVDQPVDDLALMQGAISGMLESLGDPNTRYLSPEAYDQFEIGLGGQYEGIGAWVDTTTDLLTIISPMPGSPAEEAGLRPGDQVIAVDGEDVTDLDPAVVVNQVLGPEGTTVQLTVTREGEAEALEFAVVRASITIPSVTSEMLSESMGYVHLLQFSSDADVQLRTAIEELLNEGATSLVLDIRNNGGGLLSSAIDVTSLFIDEGVVLYEEYGDGEREIHRAIRGGIAIDIPMVVLVNEGSASASEILAGAIQDYGRAQLVGTTTFGKGSVQLPVRLANDAGAVNVTIARWLTPDERQIGQVGIEPDVVVPLTEEDIQAGLDPQLDRAVEVLEGLIGQE